MTAPIVTRIGGGAYHVVIDGLAQIVYVAGQADDRWAFCNGDIVHMSPSQAEISPTHALRHEALESITAPMPATVLKIATTVGARVKKGETLLILEAMKMELPLRASGDGVVKAIHCREGELVQPDHVLIALA
jgi:biotin carboxyl carrier protein